MFDRFAWETYFNLHGNAIVGIDHPSVIVLDPTRFEDTGQFPQKPLPSPEALWDAGNDPGRIVRRSTNRPRPRVNQPKLGK